MTCCRRRVRATIFAVLLLSPANAVLRLAAVPPVCPPGLREAGPALDDLERWAAGSFDEIVLACDLKILTEEDYAVLVEAITP